MIKQLAHIHISTRVISSPLYLEYGDNFKDVNCRYFACPRYTLVFYHLFDSIINAFQYNFPSNKSTEK